MVVIVFVMLLCLGIGLAVVIAVAVPARREGRDLLTPHGEQVVARVRERTESMTSATKDRTEGLFTSAKDKVGRAAPEDETGRESSRDPAPVDQ